VGYRKGKQAKECLALVVCVSSQQSKTFKAGLTHVSLKSGEQKGRIAYHHVNDE